VTEFWRKWLVVASAGVAAIGVAFTVIAVTGAEGVLGDILKSVYPGDDPDTQESGLLLIGITGAVMAGWTTLAVILFSDPTTASRPATWRGLAGGLTVWFLLDSTASIATGATLNLVPNVIFLAVFAPALAATRPRSAQSRGG